MGFDFTIAFGKAEDFLRRHIKPKAVQEAERRRRQRKRREVGKRLTRASYLGGGAGAGLVGYEVLIGSMGMPGLATAGAAAAVGIGATLFWPARSNAGRKISREELDALIGDAEHWLLEQREILPGRALPAFDMIFFRLNDLHPRLATLEPNSTLAWDLRRLLTNHLPRLVQSYSELPATVRDPDAELLQRLIDGLGTLDEELIRICHEASREHLTTFEAQERFLEARYKDGTRLRDE